MLWFIGLCVGALVIALWSLRLRLKRYRQWQFIVKTVIKNGRY